MGAVSIGKFDILATYTYAKALLDGRPDIVQTARAAGLTVTVWLSQSLRFIDTIITHGLPLDLATINLARGRDTGIPTLNQQRTVTPSEILRLNTAIAPDGVPESAVDAAAPEVDADQIGVVVWRMASRKLVESRAPESVRPRSPTRVS